MTRPVPQLPPLADLETVPTPALIVDVGTARHNHALAQACLGPKQRLTAHFKAHKSTALAHLQLALGAASMCCQTSWEAVALAQAGFKEIMVTNQLADPTALDEVCLAARSARVSSLADGVVHIRRLDAAASANDVQIGVLIEIDLGMRRCGVAPDSDDLLFVAKELRASKRLSLAGLQAYDGRSAGTVDPQARRDALARAAVLTRLATDRLEAAGFAVPIVAGCATGHLPFVRDLETWTDIQAGSYLLMDGVYSDCLDLNFTAALFALATVIHRSEDRIVLDVGLKQLAVDRGTPAWAGDPSAVLRLSDEHAVIPVGPSVPLAVGDRTFVLPRHIDPTVNLHPTLWLYDKGAVTPVPVDGRMPERSRSGRTEAGRSPQ